ncbi:MAG: hypothetical protein A2133_10105 [Actinobacteria bacterium RBG_16_64_13]|nr:MAG: hypothetical protein A2133_10105 [Actinobacteria bacterium RBG_16_64_13]
MQAGLMVLGLVMIAIPPLAMALQGFAKTPASLTVLRMAALEAFTLVVADLVTGAFRPWLNRVFKARKVQRFHTVVALTGFSLAIAHGTIALIQGVSTYVQAAVWLGPVVVFLLFAAILTALTRRRLRRSWRWVHRANYLLFAIVLVHSLVNGYNLQTQVFLKVIFGVYAAVFLAGFYYRLNALLKTRRRPA